MTSLDNLSHYVRVYDNAFPKHLCQELIKGFEDRSEKSIRQEYNGYPNFHLMYVTKMKNRTLGSSVSHHLNDVYQKYKKDINQDFFPKKPITMSQPKVKKYDMGTDDRYDRHVDITNQVDAKRYVAFLIFLNTVEEGGSTVFDSIGTVNAVQGRCIVFPPNWLYPHAGLRAISDNKYILSAYGLYK